MERETETAGGSLRYRLEENRAVIMRFETRASSVVIPDALEGLPVKELGRKCFLGQRLTEVIVPDTVEYVGDFCFAGASALRRAELPGEGLSFGRMPFLNCAALEKLTLRKKEAADEQTAALLALAAVEFGSSYLLDVREAGSAEWYQRWDSRLRMELHTPDNEGHTNVVLCGEEDYESTNLEGFISAKRRKKAEFCLKRLLCPKRLAPELEAELAEYVRGHTKGADSEEAWQLILEKYGENRPYYSLFAQLDCVTPDNLEGVLADIGERFPEMKAFFLRRTQQDVQQDFFAGLEL